MTTRNKTFVICTVFIMLGMFLLGVVAPALMSAPDTFMVLGGIATGMFAIMILFGSFIEAGKLMFPKEENASTKETQE